MQKTYHNFSLLKTLMKKEKSKKEICNLKNLKQNI